MNLELTDLKRYELEKENVINILLAAARRGILLNEQNLAFALNIDLATTNKLITKLKSDNIIK